MSEKMPTRDTSGKCEGDCKDQVNEGRQARQKELEKEDVQSPDSYPKAPGAGKRDNPPGEMGGHV
jgi:hypothetical protein